MCRVFPTSSGEGKGNKPPSIYSQRQTYQVSSLVGSVVDRLPRPLSRGLVGSLKRSFGRIVSKLRSSVGSVVGRVRSVVDGVADTVSSLGSLLFGLLLRGVLAT